MVKSFIERFQHYRKNQYFKAGLFQTKKKYAFIGVGMHSLTNLYPVLHHHAVRLKYICTKQSEWGPQMVGLFPDCIFTHHIEDVLQDNEVEGVIISATPDEHYPLLSACLQAGKKVFVEKPPCKSLVQLNHLVGINPSAVCKVGLQRRFWPGNKSVVKNIRKARTYTYRFHTGHYMEGDVLTSLYIHPLDYALFLFGPASLQSVFGSKDSGGDTLQLHLLHENGISGLIECSTRHSWNAPLDSLQVDCSGESLNITYPTLVEGEKKPFRLLHIPAERMLNQKVITHRYFSALNFILPVASLNTIVLQGFYHELETFIDIVENKSDLPANDLPGLVPLFRLFDQIRSAASY